MSLINLNEENFKEEVLEVNQPVLIDFYTSWCPPCRVLSPILEELAEKYKDKIKIAKLDVGEEQNLAQKYNIMSVPTLIVFQKGKETKRIIGLISKKEIEKILESL